MTRVCIVGNAPLTTDHATLIDGFDQVIRFNIPAGWGDVAGTKFDTWVLGGGRSGQKFIRTMPFIDAPYRDAASEIWIAHDPSVHAQINAQFGDTPILGEKDHSAKMKRVNNLPQPITRFRPPIYRKCLKLLGNPHQSHPPLVPSSGFMTLQYLRKHQPDAQITMVGFGFAGGPKHPWDMERRVVHDMVDAGQVTLLPL